MEQRHQTRRRSSVFKLTKQILALQRKVRALKGLRNAMFIGAGLRSKKGLTARLMAARRSA